MKMEDFHCTVSPFGFFIFAEGTNTLLSIIFSFIILLSWFVAQVEILWLPLLRCAVSQILAPFEVVTSDMYTIHWYGFIMPAKYTIVTLLGSIPGLLPTTLQSNFME